jgi:hypothetical protein
VSLTSCPRLAVVSSVDVSVVLTKKEKEEETKDAGGTPATHGGGKSADVPTS